MVSKILAEFRPLRASSCCTASATISRQRALQNLASMAMVLERNAHVIVNSQVDTKEGAIRLDGSKTYLSDRKADVQPKHSRSTV